MKEIAVYYTKKEGRVATDNVWGVPPWRTLHRFDGPALIYKDNNGVLLEEYWIQNGRTHRIGAPAVIEYFSNGKKYEESWFVNDELHRMEGPAITCWYRTGQIAHKQWYQNNCLHRIDGPAYIKYKSGQIKETRWCLHGEELPFYEVENWIEENKIDVATKKGQFEFMLRWS